MARERNQKRGLLWAWLGGAILLLGVIAIIVAAIVNQPPSPVTSPTSGAPTKAPTTPPASAPGEFVDASVAEFGWVPEPITADPDVYIPRALEAAATFDTQMSSRADWLTYLDSWFTPDTRYTSEADQHDALKTAQLELRQSVVLPEDEWDSLAQEEGRVSAAATGDISYYPEVPHDESGDMRIATSDVVLTFTRIDGDGAEYSYDEQVRVSVQVLCGPGSVPTPDSAQASGDCKVVRYFAEPMEP
ncbi:hypothetical protein [Microbacterium sp. GXF0217]